MSMERSSKTAHFLIDPEYMTVVSRLVDQGIHFVVCSGRQFSSEQKLFAPIKDRLLYISDGGTVAHTGKDSENISDGNGTWNHVPHGI